MKRIDHATIVDAETIDSDESDVREKTPEERLAAVPRAFRCLDPNRLEGAEFSMPSMSAIVPDGVDFEMAQVPSFWMHTLPKMMPRMRIFLTADNFTWAGEVLVVDVDRLGATVVPLSFWKFEPIDHDANHAALGIVPLWISVSKKYGVRRLADGVILSHGHPNKWAAAQWILSYARSGANLRKVGG